MKYIIILMFASLFNFETYGQSSGVTPMHKFFQQNADSTIIIEIPTSYTYQPSYYRVLSKTKDTINCFVYDAVKMDTTAEEFYRNKKQFPIIFGEHLKMKKFFFSYTPADINIFFRMVQLPVNIAKKLWFNIQKLEPWKLVDDSEYGNGCKAFTSGSEEWPSIIHIITKNEIKTLVYEAPAYFETQCPGNKNRQAIIKIDKLFYDNYPKFNMYK